jgi:CelD/BcsL family acetyltransferase involved in cellulose biosynthesis
MNLVSTAPGRDIAEMGFSHLKGLSLGIVTSFDVAEQWKIGWDKLVGNQGANVYMTFDWCRIWWLYYGENRDLRVMVFHKEEQLVAILPFFVEYVRFGMVRIKLAKLIGSDFSLQLCNPPVLEEYAATVFRAASQYLIKTCKCDAINLSPLSTDLVGFSELQNGFKQEMDWVGSTRERVVDCHSKFSLPGTFDDYVKGLGKSPRANYKRDCNLLCKSFTVACDTVIDPSKILAEFESFRRLHTDQWNAEGRNGHFDDWPKAYEFNLDLIKAQAEQGRSRLYRLSLNGAPVSYQYGFAFQNTLFWRLPARKIGSDWHRFGLGRMGLAKLIESAIREGITSIEGGQGHYDYKVQLGATEHPVYSISLLSAEPGIKARFRLAQMFSELWDITYYKLLFRRVYPRVPYLRGPLASSWIRTRI